MKKFLIAGMMLAAASVASATVIIDPFATTSQLLTATGSGGVSATGAIGGNRFSSITKVSGAGSDTLDINTVNAGLLTFSTAANDDSNIMVRWDGDTNNTLDFGLTPIGNDLTELGLNTLIRLSIQSDLVTSGTIRIYEDATNYSTATFNTPALGFGSFTNIDLLFTSFVNTGGGANFAAAKAIELTIAGVPTGGLDARLDFISADHNDTPEPATFALIGGGLAALAFLRKRKVA